MDRIGFILVPNNEESQGGLFVRAVYAGMKSCNVMANVFYKRMLDIGGTGKHVLFFIALIFSLGGAAQAATYYSRATGSWNTASTWSTVGCGGAAAASAPGAGDDIVVCSGNTVTVTANASAKSLDVSGTIVVNNNVTLTINGSVTVENSGNLYLSGNTSCNGNNISTLLVYGNYTNYGNSCFWKSYAVIQGDLTSPSASGVQNNGYLVVGGDATGVINQTGGSSVYPINPNATISLSGTTPITTAPTSPAYLVDLINTVIFQSSCGFTINGPSNVTSCSGSTVTFSITSTTATSPTYQWEENQGSSWAALANGGVYSNVTTATLTISGATAGMNGFQYRCKITDASSCSKYSYSATLTVATSPTATAGGPNSVCQSASPSAITLTGASVGGGATSGAWSIISGGGALSSTAQTGTPASITYTPANNYSGGVTLRLTTNSVGGCVATSDRTITVNPLLAASVSISSSANPVCSGTSVTYTATPTNGGTTPSYQWKVNGSNAGTNSSTYSFSPSNNDVVSCVMTSNATCVSGSPATSNSVTMTVNPVVTASVSISASANPVCSGTSVTYTATPTNGGTTPSYQWKVNGSNAGTNSSTYSFSPSNNDVVSCVITSNAMCVSGSPATSNSVTMTVNPVVTASVSISASANPVCSGTSVTYTATPTNGGTTPSYQWKVNGINAGTNSNTYSYTPSNNDVVSCVMTSNATCVSGSPATSNSITMAINLLPFPVIAGSNVVCAGSLGNVYTTDTGKSNYAWSVTGGTVTAGGGTSDNSITITWGAAGTGHVYVNYTDSNSCTGNSSTDYPVTIDPLPTTGPAYRLPNN